MSHHGDPHDHSTGSSSEFWAGIGGRFDRTFISTTEFLTRYPEVPQIRRPNAVRPPPGFEIPIFGPPPAHLRPHHFRPLFARRPPSSGNAPTVVLLNSMGQPISHRFSAFRPVNPIATGIPLPPHHHHQLSPVRSSAVPIDHRNPSSVPVAHHHQPVNCSNPTSEQVQTETVGDSPGRKRPRLTLEIDEEDSEKTEEIAENTPHAPSANPKLDKGKAKVGTFSELIPSKALYFSSNEALLRFPAFVNKFGQSPKGFHPHALLAFPQLKEKVEILGWEIFGQVPKPYNIDWVRDFYTELSISSSLTLLVRHTTVCYDACSINEILGLTPPQSGCELERLINHATDQDLQTILKRIAHDGSEWSFKGQSRFLRTHCLLPEANVWYYFVRHNLYPATHDTHLCMVRVFALFCIMDGRKFDVGRLISKNISGGADRANARLPHPQIIHALMEKSNAPILVTDNFCNDKMVIERANIERLMRNNLHFHPQLEDDGLVSVDTSFNNLKIELKALLREYSMSTHKQMTCHEERMTQMMDTMMNRMMRMDEKLTDWFEYEKHRDDVLRAIWKKDHPDCAETLPKFPIHLLWKTTDQHPTRHE